MNLAAAYLGNGQLRQAADLWKEIVRTQPNRSDVRLDLATAQWQLGEYDNARYHFAYVLKSDPTNARALNGVGMWYHRNAQFSAAAESFRGAIKSNPNFVPAYNNLGIVYEKMNKRPEAIKLFEKALSIDPNNAEVRRNLERVRSQYKG